MLFPTTFIFFVGKDMCELETKNNNKKKKKKKKAANF